MSNQKQTVEGLVIDLIRIRAAAKGIEGILASALSNASGNIEHDDVSRRVRGFREALECLPEAEPTDTKHKYAQLFKSESYGSYGSFAIRIDVSEDLAPYFDSGEVYTAARNAANSIQSELMYAHVSTDPRTKEKSDAERAELLGCFESPIFAEEIPNGYCKDWCCRHLPWFIVTTPVGRLTIGWRKRVIAIDWEQIKNASLAEVLFPDDKVTKWNRSIHAWSVEDARRYVAAIIESAKSPACIADTES